VQVPELGTGPDRVADPDKNAIKNETPQNLEAATDDVG
jgi:hypothetical protein